MTEGQNGIRIPSVLFITNPDFVAEPRSANTREFGKGCRVRGSANRQTEPHVSFAGFQHISVVGLTTCGEVISSAQDIAYLTYFVCIGLVVGWWISVVVRSKTVDSYYSHRFGPFASGGDYLLIHAINSMARVRAVDGQFSSPLGVRLSQNTLLD